MMATAANAKHPPMIIVKYANKKNTLASALAS